MNLVTADRLLGGRVRYRQPLQGYRTGIEPVLLAASVPARAGERVLEGGTGAGAALLCLAARRPGVTGLGVEIDPGLAALAQQNLRENDAIGIEAIAGDILDLRTDLTFDHAIANPPWHAVQSTASPDPVRDTARRGRPDLIGKWTRALAAALRHGGSVTLIVPAAAMAAAFAAMSAAQCGSHTLLPLWPHAGKPARIVLVRAIKGGRGESRILPGLVLHDGRGFTAAAHAILWDAAELSWD